MIKKYITLLLLFLGINSFSQNLFQNPGFENGLDSNYVSFVKSGGEATFTIAADTSVQGDSVLVVDIKTIPSGGPQVIGIYQYVSGLNASKAYEFKFAVKGPAGQKVRARIQGNSKQIEWFEITNSYKYYTWKIDPLNPSSDGLHKIGLEFGDLPENQAGGLWHIDDWSFTELGDSGEPVEPGGGNLSVAYVSPDGNDENAGTKSAPLKTLKSAIQQLAGDTIYLLEGTYHEEIQIKDFSGTASKTKVITAFPGHKVKFDGTIPIHSRWELHEGNIYKTTLEQDIWQLFENEKMLNAARWPNVEGYIEDEQPVAPLPNPNSLWDQPGTWGKSAYNSTNGNMIDDGTQNLAGVETSFTGGIAILNIGSFRTSSARIFSHNPGESWFRYYSEDLQVHWEKPDKAFYYVEGKLSLLDHPGEWFYEPSTKELFVWTKSGAKPDSGSIRGKVQTYALNLKDCKHAKVQGINFFATTIKGDGCE
ncbi:MAG: carbohydrate binding domain-containing protein, partial [Prolixibacteraceae bacterium]|nr:carbohydrate binding domain-containing protein [Prolixibacteraceae bacterium]